MYKITDTNDSTFYIGKINNHSIWDSGYMGSGVAWNKHLKKYPPYDPYNPAENAHIYVREILHDHITDEEELCELEFEEINKYFSHEGSKIVKLDEKCMNTHSRVYGVKSVCPICSKSNGWHERDCPNYRE